MATVEFIPRNEPPDASLELSEAVQKQAGPLASAGAASVFVVQMPLLAEIERAYGPSAYEKVARALSETVQRYSSERFLANEFVVASARRGEEAVIIVTRSRARSSFYKEELPKISQELGQFLEGQRSRIVYPYGAERAGFSVGYGVAIHNPGLRPDRQLLLALDDARGDADLSGRLRKREIGRQVLGVILDQQVRCVYQPVATIQTGKVIGYEALARGPSGTEWRSPLTLFKYAAEFGLAYELDCLCRRAALCGGDRWTNPNLMLFLNCLPSAIHDPNFSEERLRQTLQTSGLLPSNVVLEVSERESIRNFSIFREARERYRNLGIKIALDDTGAGYAGLETVMELAPDFIKVDISLVRSIDTDMGRRVLLQALQDMSEVIGAKLIAEGIETEGELQALRRMGVPYGQGYLIGRPGPFSLTQAGAVTTDRTET